MKKILRSPLTFIIVAVVVFLCSCSDNENESIVYDFRHSFWDMSRTELTNSETSKYEFADDDVIMYSLEQFSQQAEIYYEFTGGKLYDVECRFGIDERTLSTLIESYLSIRDELSAEYGEPISPEYRVWIDKDPLYELDSDSHQLYYKRMKYITEWTTPRSDIKLSLDYSSGRINYILYLQKAED